jgi:hypothetical protein
LVAAAPPPPDTTVPAPTPVLIWLSPLKADPTPVVELYDGGGGLPNLGSSTAYNAGDWESLLRSSHDAGVYDKGIAEIDYLADAYLAHQAGRRVAIVLDVDETSLSNYGAIEADNFTFGPNRQAAVTNEIGVAIKPTLDLFNLARSRGIAVFFLSERRENARDHTTSNLLREGYSDWTQLILKPDDSTQSTVEYKSSARESIEKQGYRIVATIGDQYADFAGGHVGIGFKLPNPYYFVP